MGNSTSGSRNARTFDWWPSSNNGHLTTADDIMTEEPIPDQDQVVIDNDESESESKSEDGSSGSSRPISPEKAKELEEFKKQLLEKREFRQKVISERREELHLIKRQLEQERRLREESINENKLLLAVIAENNIAVPRLNVNRQEIQEEHECIVTKLEEQVVALKDLNRALQCQIAESNLEKQSLTTEVTMLNKESTELKRHIQSLKDVNKVTKEMIAIRESQLQQLKDKLVEIEKSLADREIKTLSCDLRAEYERQLANIRNLRGLYEERARVAEATRLNLVREVDEHKILAESYSKKCGELQTRINELEQEISDKTDKLGNTEDQLGLSKAETRDLQADMTVINQLFSQILLGCNNSQDLDKLVSKLEENHDLLADMVVREDCTEVASALPKLILELVSQVEASDLSGEGGIIKEKIEDSSIDDDASGSKTLTSAKEIVGNLPKVWKVLIELLSHQAGPQLVSDISDKSSSSCYKSVETPSGTRLVPSVSKTYIRLKDLILEKKFLQKEMGRLKHLNCHLENRLQDQERRLGLVSSELNKTWHVVGRMQRQHQQLHTQERILQFELQQKRISLTKLKEELEFCKEKWDKAKQKNSESQEEWNKLRIEFANRKLQSVENTQNSPESGYSDGKASDDDSIDLEKKTERKRIKRKGRSTDNINELNDSDVVQEDNEELIEPIELLSDSETQCSGNFIGIEEQAIDEVLSNVDEPDGSSERTIDDIMTSRSDRLKILEEQCHVLVHKVTKTNEKGVELCSRLEELHTKYGNSEGECSGTQIKEADEEGSSSDQCVAESITELESNENNLRKITEDKGGTDLLENAAGTSSTIPNKFDYEARFAARDIRLKKMEEQAKSLVDKVSNTTTRGEVMSMRLTGLHNIYGKSDDDEASTSSDKQEADNEAPKVQEDVSKPNSEEVKDVEKSDEE